MDFVLSPKYKDFLKYNDAVFEILEGTTASGKTTTGIVKFLLKVAKSKQKLHIISGQDLGVVEKNIINCDLGILDIFGDLVEYNSKGKGEHTLAHIVYHTPIGDKIIYILGYDNEARWKKALGGQYGCVYVDEINTASMSYVRQVAMRCDYFMGTLNPDDPDKEIYKEYINRCRPIEKYKDDGPKDLLAELDEPHTPGWVWWYFSFEHNKGLSKEKVEKIKNSHSPGTSDHRHYILGLRGKAEGIIFDNFDSRKHCITYKESLDLVKGKGKDQKEWFVLFSGGLDTAYSKNSDDTIAMSFIGITNTQKVYLLDECVMNNRDEKVPFAPSDIALKYNEFLEKNRKVYGFAPDTFIDSADQATITELKKFKAKTGSIYNFNNSYKALKIIDRIQLQKGWFATGHMFIVNTCTTYIKELKTYSWSDKKNKTEPEDANDHMINSVQYAWIPYKNKIG
jgi:PBSX family phage terminase large subunit